MPTHGCVRKESTTCHRFIEAANGSPATWLPESDGPISGIEHANEPEDTVGKFEKALKTMKKVAGIRVHFDRAEFIFVAAKFLQLFARQPSRVDDAMPIAAP